MHSPTLPSRTIDSFHGQIGRTMIALLSIIVMLTSHVTIASDHDPNRRWTPEVVARFQSLPIQDAGRIKPVDTYAGFKLLKLHGTRSIRVPSSQGTTRLTPVEWLLDCLFFPEEAVAYPTFNVDSSEVIVAIGVTPHAKKRDRYSYNELQPGLGALFSLARQYAEIEEKNRTRTQNMVVRLASNVSDFEFLIHYLDFARHSAAPAEIVANTAAMQPFARTAIAMAIFPPADMTQTRWLTIGDLITQSENLTLVEPLATMVASRDRSADFYTALTQLHDRIVQMAQVRGEYDKITLEVAFYRGRYFYHSLILYVFSFLLIAVSWLTQPDSRMGRRLRQITPIAVMIPLALNITGVVLRCIIRGRPPVSTLYETVLFITAVCVLTGLVIEYMTRLQIALSVASFLGAAGMFLAIRYEMKEVVDTMPSLVAVLDTNFWLSTHVTTVTVGYSAGLLAAALAHVYIVGRFFRWQEANAALYAALTRMVYGVICFGLFFSFIGTVLGGIWANYSWGRFWGWDPKENGALMIVLWNLIILHARMGGMIRTLGIHVCAVFGAMIVAFSWWGVNLLGIGLHSYGFTSGVMRGLVLFWSIEAAVMFLGLQLWLRERTRLAREHCEPASGVRS